MQYQTDVRMDRRQLFRVAGLGALAVSLPSSALAFAAREYPFLQSKLKSYLDERKAAGIVMAIGHGNEAPDIIKGGKLSFASTTPVDRHSLFRIYSMTKPITGIAAMMLVEDGKIKLDQPIADFLPEFAKMQVLTDPDKSMDAVPAKTQITLRHLLTHTAGLGYSIISKGPIREAYVKAGVVPGQVSLMTIPGLFREEPVRGLANFADRLAPLPLVAEPGTKWSYSVSLDLTAHLIAVVGGMDYDAFLQHRIFDPLGMDSTFFRVPKGERDRLTTNYGIDKGELIAIDPAEASVYNNQPAFAFGGAGLVCSAHDYDRFLHCLMNYGELDGKRIMSAETARLAMSNLLPAGISTDGTFAHGAGFGAGGRVGLGAQAGSFGWGGAAGTNAFLSTKYRVRATGMIQYMPANQQDFQNKFPEWVIADLIKQGAFG